MSVKVVTEPKVYVVGRQSVDPGLRRFLADEGVPDWDTDAPTAAETLVEAAGRLCYLSFKHPRPGGNAAYIGHILEVGHGSVLEHAVFSVIIAGVSRSLTHELVRHRVGFGFSQLSQRYVDESDVAFVVPPLLLSAVAASREFWEGRDVYDVDLDAGVPDEVVAGDAWLGACKAALSAYRHLCDEHLGDPAARGTARRKQVREAARSALPNSTETKIFLTGNARAWRHLIESRGSADADAEFRRLAVALLGALKPEAPHLFADMEAGPDGTVTARHHKV